MPKKPRRKPRAPLAFPSDWDDVSESDGSPRSSDDGLTLAPPRLRGRSLSEPCVVSLERRAARAEAEAEQLREAVSGLAPYEVGALRLLARSRRRLRTARRRFKATSWIPSCPCCGPSCWAVLFWLFAWRFVVVNYGDLLPTLSLAPICC